MAKAGRKRHNDAPVNWKLSVPQSIAVQVELLLYDPLLNRVAYSARSAYVSGLIREDLARRGVRPKETQNA